MRNLYHEFAESFSKSTLPFHPGAYAVVFSSIALLYSNSSKL